MQFTREMSFIVTGLPASGKTTIAADLAKMLVPSPTLILADNFRYVDDKWTKAPRDLFLARIADKIALVQDDCTFEGEIVYDSAYYDAHDPEQARIHAVHAIIRNAPVGKKPTVVRIRALNRKDALKSLMHRILGRAAGTVPQGACPETLDSVTAMVDKFLANYDANQAALDSFEIFAKSEGCRVVSLPYADARAALGL